MDMIHRDTWFFVENLFSINHIEFIIKKINKKLLQSIKLILFDNYFTNHILPDNKFYFEIYIYVVSIETIYF